MKNLFIMHTQYNLILSAAVALKNPEDSNTLVLYSEFRVTDDIVVALSRVFDEVIIVRENFEKLKKPVEEVKYIRKLLKKVECLKEVFFDCVYMSQERIFDKILLTRARKINPGLSCYDIEEDAYYSIDNKYNDDEFVFKTTFRQKRRDCLMRLLLAGYPYNYKERGYCYGMSSEYDGVNLLFPHLCRRELKNKELIEVTSEELLCGIDAIYRDRNCSYPDAKSYVIMFFDLINRYKNRELVADMVKQISDVCHKNNITMLAKYHPRETEKFKDIGQVYEIDQIIPAEKVLKDLYGNNVTVFGNATTSCVVAAKLGYKVVSIAKLESPENTKMHTVFEKMGIVCIDGDDNIEKTIC